MNVRHYVIMRKDLQLEKISVGLFAAQVSHVADNFLLETQRLGDPPANFAEEELEWAKTPVLVVLGVNTYEELQDVKKRAQDEGLPVRSWRDTIPSNLWEDKFMDVEVGISIGPIDTDKAKIVVGNLPTY